MLTKRQELILFLIVDEFLAAMVPVSSKQIIQKYQLDISSATVRNEMVKLEASGFLTKPHTSAGRMPSREALKFYIGKLSEKLDEESYTEPIPLHLNSHHNPEDLSRSTAAKISALTNYLTGVSFTGKDETVKGIYFTPLNEDILLVIIVLESGDIKEIPVRMDYSVSLETLKILTNYFNQTVIDTPLQDLSELLRSSLKDTALEYTINSVADSLRAELDQPRKFSGYSGFNHLIQQISEDTDTLRTLYDDLEADQLDKIIDITQNDGVDIYLGDELPEDYHSISIITTNFKLAGFDGNLMIIGPEMMGYKKVIRLLHAINNQSTKGSE
jgi:heat-inducible transcriptional repressor